MPKNLCNFADKLKIKTNINTMAKRGQNKQNKSQQLTPEAYLRQRARSLEIGPCYASDIFGEAGEGIVIVTRKHSGGKFSMGVYMIDAFCLGIKDSTYNMWIEDYEVKDIIDHFGELKPCTYEEAHNMVYGAMEFALEAGIQPHKSFALTKYMLEEDDEHVPLIDYPFGKDGKHFLVVDTRQEANRYLPLLRKNLGEGNFEFSIAQAGADESEEDGYMSSPQSTTMMENLETFKKHEILDFAEILHLDIPQKGTENQIKKAYIQAIYDHPLQVLERLPLSEIMLLSCVKDLDKGYRQLPLVNLFEHPMFTDLGIAEPVGLVDNVIYVVVADDFVEKVLVHLNLQQLLESQQERYQVECLFNEATSLYGVVSQEHMKQIIADYLALSQQEASEMFDRAREQSALFEWIKLDLNIFSRDEDKIFYHNKYMWDNLAVFIKKQKAERSIKYLPFPKECLLKSEAVYFQLNDQQADFTQFLKVQFRLDDDAVQDVCFNLWYRAQHEEDPDFEHESYMDYFMHEVFAKITPSKRSKFALEEAMSHLQAYMNAMPRWILKGYSPKEIR